jgi:hypothetical protein
MIQAIAPEVLISTFTFPSANQVAVSWMLRARLSHCGNDDLISMMARATMATRQRTTMMRNEGPSVFTARD